MADESIDPEALAALLDGTLPADERMRVLSRLSRSDALYEEFIEASAVLAELGVQPASEEGAPSPAAPPTPAPPTGDGQPGSPRHVDPPPAESAGPDADATLGPGRSGPGRWRRRGLWAAVPLLAAAGIAIAVVTSRDRTEGRVLAVVDELVVTGQRPTDWGHREWATVRGAGDDVTLQVRAFRMGVLLADLEIAFRMRDTAAVGPAASTLASLASGIETGGAVVMRISHVARDGGGRASPEERAQMAAELRSLSGAAEWFDLGTWSESARFAARTRQVQFFAPAGPAMQSLSRRLAALDRLPPSERRGAAPELERLRRVTTMRISSLEQLDAVAATLDSVVVGGGGGG